MTKVGRESTKRAFPLAATDRERRFYADLAKSNPLPDTIKNIEFHFDEDSDGEPAVWITLIVDDDLNPPIEKITALNRAAQSLSAAVIDSEFNRWPYIQIKTG